MSASSAYPHPAALDIDALMRDCKCTRARRSGPGGQHRNKVETAYLIEHLPTGVAAEANERRSLEENRKVAVTRLRIRLAIVVRLPHPVGNANTGSELWCKRRRGGKIDVSDSHLDYPAILAEALDRLDSASYKVSDAASSLQVTTSSLVKLIARSPEALTVVNRARAERKLPQLRCND